MVGATLGPADRKVACRDEASAAEDSQRRLEEEERSLAVRSCGCAPIIGFRSSKLVVSKYVFVSLSFL